MSSFLDPANMRLQNYQKRPKFFVGIDQTMHTSQPIYGKNSKFCVVEKEINKISSDSV